MKNKLSLLALALVSATVASAQTAVDYGAVLNTNLDVIDAIWGVVAGIIIAVALVKVGARFFKKAS